MKAITFLLFVISIAHAGVCRQAGTESINGNDTDGCALVQNVPMIVDVDGMCRKVTNTNPEIHFVSLADKTKGFESFILHTPPKIVLEPCTCPEKHVSWYSTKNKTYCQGKLNEGTDRSYGTAVDNKKPYEGSVSYYCEAGVWRETKNQNCY